MIDAVIFDLDGTLWDSCASVAGSWRQTLAEHYGGLFRPTEQDIRGIMGMNTRQIAQTLFSVYGDEAQAVCEDCIARQFAYIAHHGSRLYPGVEDLFRTLSQARGIYIVSNCEPGYIECFIEYTGFGKYIDDYECSGATGLSKADNIRLIVRRNHIREPIYVGDTYMDEESAAEAGLPFIHAAYGFGQTRCPAAVIHAPLELINIIDEWNGVYHV